MNIISIITYGILMPITLRYFFVKAREAREEANQTMSDEHFTIKFPFNYFVVGVAGIIVFGTIMLGFTLSTNASPDNSKPPTIIIFYAFFGGFCWLCLFLALKATKFKVVVKGNKIAVYPLFAKPYSFTFDEIVSVFRELSYNRLNSEVMEIKTVTKKTFVVDSAGTAYERFLRRIKSEVKSEFLDGFD